ncbi:MAG: hypothetical protein H7287_13285 [Thermoleophilia bacterium]|nr:hypothetical protein [Thermoleophilia bacterium]
MAAADEINERRTFRLLPSDEIGFAKPAIEYENAQGETKVKVASDFTSPQPEFARTAGDPGWYVVNVWLPIGAVPKRLIADPNAQLL